MKRFFTFFITLILTVCSLGIYGCGKELSQQVIEGSDASELLYTEFKKGTPVSFGKYVFRGLDGDTMPISGYLGPQGQGSYPANGYYLPSLIKEEVYQKLQDCGINQIIENDMDASTMDQTTLQQVLTLAQNHNISYFLVVSAAIKYNTDHQSEWFCGSVEDIKNVLTDLCNYKSFAGIYLRDEPYEAMFEGFSETIKRYNEAKNAIGENELTLYHNLFPSIDGKRLSGDDNNTMNWLEYINTFAGLGVDYISFDSYPIQGMGNSVASTWFDSLGTMSVRAKAYNIPFMACIQAGGGETAMASPMARIVNEYELAWNVNTALAFGAKGLSYYPLVYPGYFAYKDTEEHANDSSLINKYGNKTPTYNYAQKVNKQVQAIDHVLMNAAHEGIIIHGESPCEYSGIYLNSRDLLLQDESYRGLSSVEGDAALIGCFDYNGSMALLVVNNSLTEHRGEIKLNFKDNYGYRVTQRAKSAVLSAKSFVLTLEAGECALVEIL